MIKDTRTEKQFAKDIKESTLTEQKLMETYVKWLNKNKRGKYPYTFINHGVDNSGKYIRNRSKVNTNADFILRHKSKKDRKIEIKFSRKKLESFHIKVKQLRDYIRNDVCLVNFVGVDEKHLEFCILRPQDMMNFFLENQLVEFKPWDYKLCVRIKYEDVQWYQV